MYVFKNFLLFIRYNSGDWARDSPSQFQIQAYSRNCEWENCDFEILEMDTWKRSLLYTSQKTKMASNRQDRYFLGLKNNVIIKDTSIMIDYEH